MASILTSDDILRLKNSIEFTTKYCPKLIAPNVSVGQLFNTLLQLQIQRDDLERQRDRLLAASQRVLSEVSPALLKILSRDGIGQLAKATER